MNLSFVMAALRNGFSKHHFFSVRTISVAYISVATISVALRLCSFFYDLNLWGAISKFSQISLDNQKLNI